MPLSTALPTKDNWADFYKKFHRLSGLDLTLYKQDQLQRRIVSMMESKACANLDAFYTFVSASSSSTQWFLDRLAINVSELFRNPEKWGELEKIILPKLLKNSNSLKIWSAGCSYGAEAHSLACVLDAKFPGNHSIVGTDIDQEALAQAKRGEFNDSDMKAVPKEYQKYFVREGEHFKAVAPLKKYLQFKTQNLLADRFETGFDLICCRNVVIYFSDEAKDALYKRFHAALKPGGILFVGGTERIFNAKEIGLETAVPFFYQKPIEQAGSREWRNAS